MLWKQAGTSPQNTVTVSTVSRRSKIQFNLIRFCLKLLRRFTHYSTRSPFLVIAGDSDDRLGKTWEVASKRWGPRHPRSVRRSDFLILVNSLRIASVAQDGYTVAHDNVLSQSVLHRHCSLSGSGILWAILRDTESTPIPSDIPMAWLSSRLKEPF